MTKEIDFKNKQVVFWDLTGDTLKEFYLRLRSVLEAGAEDTRETRSLILNVMAAQGMIGQEILRPRSMEHFKALLKTWEEKTLKKRKDNG